MAIFPKQVSDVNGSVLKNDAPLDEGALLFRIRNGNAEAFSELLKRYEGMLRKLSHSFSGVPDSETEDLYQDGLIGFYKAALCYSEGAENASSFSTFAYLCARRSMLSSLKKLSRDAKTLSMEDLETEPESSHYAPEQSLIDHENLNALIRSFDTVLSDYEASVLKLTLSGRTPGQVAKNLQKSEKSVSNALFRAREKLSAHYKR